MGLALEVQRSLLVSKRVCLLLLRKRQQNTALSRRFYDTLRSSAKQIHTGNSFRFEVPLSLLVSRRAYLLLERPVVEESSIKVYKVENKADALLEDNIKGLPNKQPKKFTATLGALAFLYHTYGMKISAMKPLKTLPRRYETVLEGSPTCKIARFGDIIRSSEVGASNEVRSITPVKGGRTGSRSCHHP